MSAVTLEVFFNEDPVGQFTFQQDEWNKVGASLRDIKDMSASTDDRIFVWFRHHGHDYCDHPDCLGELPDDSQPDFVFQSGEDIAQEYNNLDEGSDDPLDGWQEEWNRHWSETPGGTIIPPPLTVDTGYMPPIKNPYKKEEESEANPEPDRSPHPGGSHRRGLQKWFKRQQHAESKGE